jgi:hypothetical protein
LWGEEQWSVVSDQWTVVSFQLSEASEVFGLFEKQQVSHRCAVMAS